MGDKAKKISNEEIYEMLMVIKNEIKGELLEIKNRLTSIDSEVERVKKENRDLKDSNRILSSELERLKRTNRENNIIFYNIQVEDNKPLHETVIQFLYRWLGIQLEPCEINNVYTLGKKKVGKKFPPILLRLTSHLKKRIILSKLKNLKGSGVSVSDDLSVEERERRKVIYSYYKTAKSKDYSAKLFANRVVVNGKSYTYEDLKHHKLLADEEETVRGTSSGALGDLEGLLAAQEIGGKELRSTNAEIQSKIETRSRSDSKSSTSSLERLSSKNKANKK